jgi:hypothetical protein
VVKNLGSNTWKKKQVQRAEPGFGDLFISQQILPVLEEVVENLRS